MPNEKENNHSSEPAPPEEKSLSEFVLGEYKGYSIVTYSLEEGYPQDADDQLLQMIQSLEQAKKHFESQEFLENYHPQEDNEEEEESK